MARGFSRTVAAGLGWFALMSAAGAVQTQDTTTIGNPQLKDFQLPGTRTVPPANPQQQPAPTTNTATPPSVVLPPAVPLPPAQTPAATPPPAAPELEADEAPAASRTRPVQRESASPPAPTITTEAPIAAPAQAAPESALSDPPTVAPSTKWEPPVPVAEPESKTPRLYIGLGGLLALLALLGLAAFRRRRASPAEPTDAEAVAIAQPEAKAPQEPDPLFARRPAAAPAAPPTPAAPASDIVGISMRPRLELEFKADRAAATLTDASVQYELTIRNVGNAAARDVRIQPNMFNAGWEQEKEVSEFFALPVRLEEPAAFASFDPGAEAHLKGSIALPRDQLREITIEGRRLFIPIVAFNVYYEWGDSRSGQTSMSYLVGRQAPTPQDKMGAFRLDLGPRLYRSVEQRQANLAKVV